MEVLWASGIIHFKVQPCFSPVLSHHLHSSEQFIKMDQSISVPIGLSYTHMFPSDEIRKSKVVSISPHIWWQIHGHLKHVPFKQHRQEMVRNDGNPHFPSESMGVCLKTGYLGTSFHPLAHYHFPKKNYHFGGCHTLFAEIPNHHISGLVLYPTKSSSLDSFVPY